MPAVTIDGQNIFYEERGTGEPLVLIMGLGAPGSLWEEHVTAYEKHFRCILLDNRGAGQSDKPVGPYSTGLMARDAAGLMNALGIKRARVAGISMGSAIAQELALTYPDLVQSLVLVSSWSACDKYTAAVFEHFKKMRALARPADFTQLLQLWIFTAGHYSENYDQMLQDQVEAENDYMPLHAFCAQCDACITHNALDRLCEIEVPALLTVGDADIFTPLRLSTDMHARLPNSQLLTFPGLGHCHHWEDVERFNTTTTEFLLQH